jgi:hypothetical protein
MNIVAVTKKRYLKMTNEEPKILYYLSINDKKIQILVARRYFLERIQSYSAMLSMKSGSCFHIKKPMIVNFHQCYYVR